MLLFIQILRGVAAVLVVLFHLITPERAWLQFGVDIFFVISGFVMVHSVNAKTMTGMEFFNPSNAFDAEGLTRLTEQIEHRKKLRNDIEQDTLIAIRNKNLEAEKLQLEIDRESEYARIGQQREVEIARAHQRAELTRERAQKDQEGETATIAAKLAVEQARMRADQSVEQLRITKEQELQGAEISRRQATELAEQLRLIAIAQQSKTQSDAQAAADEARALAVTAEEKVVTAREVEMAERKKAIDLIAASQTAESDSIRLTMAASAEKAASADRGVAIRAQAEADADADTIKAQAYKVRAAIEAEAQHLMNEAHNMLSPDARVTKLRLRVIDKVEAIIRESVKPMERIEGIKILHVDGLVGVGQASAGSETGQAGFADSVVNSALRYRAQAPLVDQLLKDIGINAGDVTQIASSVFSGTEAPKSDNLNT